MAAKYYPEGSPEGLAEARRRIAEARRTDAEELDIGGLGLAEVPAELFELGQLKVLYLGLPKTAAEKPWWQRTQDDKKTCNAVRALPPALFASLLHLAKLHLEHNLLTSLPDTIRRATQLRLLDLGGDYDRGNQIGDGGARALSPLVSLTSLDLRGNQIGDDGARVLGALVSLTSLDLRDNRLGDDGARALGTLVNLTSLNLGGNRIGDDGARALGALVNLTWLGLRRNYIALLDPQALRTLVNLTSLDLGWNLIDAKGARALSSLVNLTGLYLGINIIGAEGARALSGLINLTSLHLESNHIGAEGARALSGLTNLTSLGLGNNDLNNDGARALSSLVNLASLNLENNHIGAEGARALSGLINLTSLFLDNNDIGAEGVRALSSLGNLAHLSLALNSVEILPTGCKRGHNGFGDDGARALGGLANLTNLNLHGTDVANLSPLLSLTKLESLDCSGCELADAFVELWEMPSLRKLILHEATLPGVPAEVLSKHEDDDCLGRLRAHFTDLAAGSSKLTEVKLMLLGNGRVGKTQIARRLRGEDYDDREPSTHGFRVSSASLPLAPGDSATLKIWDFGGQDIYHGTHALFLKTRAAFLLAWTPGSEAVRFHDHNGLTFRNEPLGYWLAYVRHFSGARAPMLIVQTQCDRPEHEVLCPPLPGEALDDFPFKKVLHYSAREDRGRPALDDGLAQAVYWLREHQRVALIGKGRAAVKAKLEKLYARGKRLITQAEFLKLCERADGISSPPALLDYLHNIDTVFYRKGLFGDAIILDQSWALDAVYAVFDRDSKAFKNIERAGGRFRRSELAEWVWKQHGEEEQKLFISFMEQCDICFVHRKGDGRVEAEYIAPDMLHSRDDPVIAAQLRDKWGDAPCDAEASFEYELLPPGLMRSLIAKVGAEAGLAAEYWRDGFYFYDEETRSRVLVEQSLNSEWAGEIRVQTRDGQAEALLEHLLKFIDERHDALGARTSGRQIAAHEPEPRAALIRPAHEPAKEPEWYVSYAWNDVTNAMREAEVDKLCTEAATRGIKIIRDKTDMRNGDRIAKFMDSIGRGDRVFIFLSDKYLRSAYCMCELFDVWRNCREDPAEFIDRTRVFVLPCAKIGTVGQRAQYAKHWRKTFAEIDALVKEDGLDVIGDKGVADYRWMSRFVHETANILELVQDVLSPRDFDAFLQYGFDAPHTDEA